MMSPYVKMYDYTSLFLHNFAKGNNFKDLMFASIDDIVHTNWGLLLKERIYRIYSAIRRGFHLSRMTTNNLISSM